MFDCSPLPLLGCGPDRSPSPDAVTASASDIRMLASMDEDKGKGARRPSFRSKMLNSSHPSSSANILMSLMRSFTKITEKKMMEHSAFAPEEWRGQPKPFSSSYLPKKMKALSVSTSPSSSQSSHKLDDVLTAQVGSSIVKYLEQCLSTEVNVLDRAKFEAIPEFHRTDLAIAGHLGKGVYSDVFEVGVTVSAYEAKYKESKEKNVMDALDVSLHGTFGSILKDAKVCQADIKDEDTVSANTCIDRRPSRGASRRNSLHSSALVSTKGIVRSTKYDECTVVYAMKCLRPCIRSDPEKFIIGAEDLVHETAMLASISHENIIKIHGRAGGDLSTAFKLNDGYFILLDKLSSTLKDRIDEWSTASLNGITTDKIYVAHSIASAIAYLHSRKIVFRDLKPQNVGFDAEGVVKLFDLGFAVGIPEEELLYDKCGTPRYMAPEVALSLGYGLEVDVYSFALLFWEICTLETPFHSIKGREKFECEVFVRGRRPEIDCSWPENIKEMTNGCWSPYSNMRPSMMHVKSVLQGMKNRTASCSETKKARQSMKRESCYI